MNPRIVLVTPRPPQGDGTGDQRRARDIVDALSPVSDLRVISWMPDGQALPFPRSLRSARRLPKLLLSRPLQVALIQAGSPARLERELAGADFVIFVTDRAPAGPLLGPNAVVDFVDDLAAVLRRRADYSTGLKRLFWRMESNRIRTYDRRLLATASVAVAHAEPDAASLGTTVRSVPLAVRMAPMPPEGDRVLFLGNLFYHPNEEAAAWICRDLAPDLQSRGIPPGRLLICGRRPSRALVRLANAAGVELRPDVPDAAAVMQQAAVVLCPTVLGTGAITKVIDAVGARRPVVLTPLANEGLGLEDGASALVRPREADPFGDAVEALLTSPALRISMAEAAALKLRTYQASEVSRAWQELVLSRLDLSAPGDPGV